MFDLPAQWAMCHGLDAAKVSYVNDLWLDVRSLVTNQRYIKEEKNQHLHLLFQKWPKDTTLHES